MKAMTGDLCWVASLLLQLRIVLPLSSYSSQFVFFPSQIFWFQIWKKSKVHFSWYLMKKKKKEPWEPREPFTVLRTTRSDRGSYESLFFSIKRFLKLKEPQKWTVRGFSDRTVRSGPGIKTMSIYILGPFWEKKKSLSLVNKKRRSKKC